MHNSDSASKVTLMVVMEYMHNGTLREVLKDLHKSEGTARINWTRRVHMALGGALGLYRIHSMQPPMLHSAIDSTKFLVDRNYEVKVRFELWGFIGLGALYRSVPHPQYAASHVA